jgi:hypothetical protein
VDAKAREATKKALELDDTLAEAHNSLGIIKMYYDWDYAAQRRSSNAPPLSIPTMLLFITGMVGTLD